MFNFFSEIKKSIKDLDVPETYNIVNVSGKILYVEGHLGITMLSKGTVAFKVKNGRIVVEGENLVLVELSENTLKISGKIVKVEAY